MLNKMLIEAYQEHILSLHANPAKEGKMKKVVLEVKISLEYPPHRKFIAVQEGATPHKTQC